MHLFEMDGYDRLQKSYVALLRAQLQQQNLLNKLLYHYFEPELSKSFTRQEMEKDLKESYDLLSKSIDLFLGKIA